MASVLDESQSSVFAVIFIFCCHSMIYSELFTVGSSSSSASGATYFQLLQFSLGRFPSYPLSVDVRLGAHDGAHGSVLRFACGSQRCFVCKAWNLYMPSYFCSSQCVPHGGFFASTRLCIHWRHKHRPSPVAHHKFCELRVSCAKLERSIAPTKGNGPQNEEDERK